MKIAWPDSNGHMVTGRIDASLWPYVEVLGLDAAARLFLHFGGSYVYFPGKESNCGTRSGVATKLAAALGPQALSRVQELPNAGSSVRIPLAQTFLARYLRSRGRNINQIAARLRKTDVTVRTLLLPDAERRARAEAAADNRRAILAAEIAAEVQTPSFPSPKEPER